MTTRCYRESIILCKQSSKISSNSLDGCNKSPHGIRHSLGLLSELLQSVLVFRIHSKCFSYVEIVWTWRGHRFAWHYQRNLSWTSLRTGNTHSVCDQMRQMMWQQLRQAILQAKVVYPLKELFVDDFRHSKHEPQITDSFSRLASLGQSHQINYW